MIVAGIGCRSTVTAEDVGAALAAGLGAYGIDHGCLGALATSADKQHQPGLVDAARRLGLPILAFDSAALAAADARCSTNSAVSRQKTGVGSLAEAAALAAAGTGSRLVGPRLIRGHVTCAIAIGKDETQSKENQ